MASLVSGKGAQGSVLSGGARGLAGEVSYAVAHNRTRPDVVGDSIICHTMSRSNLKMIESQRFANDVLCT